MIVLGADTHKRSHTVAAVRPPPVSCWVSRPSQVGGRGFGALLGWARGRDGGRVWAFEDCRHVSGSLERFLIERGERVLRIPTHLSAEARKRGRRRGSRTRSTRSRSPAPRFRGGWMRFRPRTWRGRSRSAAARRPPRTARPSSRRAQQHAALAAARSLARAAAARRRPVFKELVYTHRPAARPRQQTMRVRIARDALRRLRELRTRSTSSNATSPTSSGQLAPQLVSDPGSGR